MTWLAPIAAAPWLVWGAIALVLTVGAYLLKTRRQRFEVAFVHLWQRVLAAEQASSLWHRLKRWLSLALALFMLCLLLIAARGPVWGGRAASARTVVLLVDLSASMQATDVGGESRLAALKRQLNEFVDSMGGDDSAIVLGMDVTTTPRTRFTSDKATLRHALSSLTPSDAPADFARGLRAARDALAGRPAPLLVIASDGALTAPPVVWQATADNPAAIDLSGIDVRQLRLSGTELGASNVGIVAFSARRYPANQNAYEAFIEVLNVGTGPITRTLTIFSGDAPVDVRVVELAAGERLRQFYPKLPAVTDKLRAELDAGDALRLDDIAYALIPPRPTQRILLVSRDSLYLEAALLAYADMSPVALQKQTPDEYETATRSGTPLPVDVVLFDDYVPAALPPAPAHVMMFVADAKKLPGSTRLVRPRVTDKADHPITRWLELGDVNFDAALRLPTGTGETALLRSVRDVIATARPDNGRRVAVFGFPLPSPHREEATDLPLRVAFPLLIAGTLEWFSGIDGAYVLTHATGTAQRVPVAAGTEPRLTDPSGTAITVPVFDGQAEFLPRHVGFYSLTAGEVTVAAAANLASPEESSIAPRELTLGGTAIAAPEAFATSTSRILWGAFAIVVLVLLALEWWTFQRRWTV